VVAGSDARFDSPLLYPARVWHLHPRRPGRGVSRSRRDARRRGAVASRDQCSATTAEDGAHCFAYACPAPGRWNGCEWDGDHVLPDWAGAEIARFFSLTP
jgi:hypothetical protein